MSFPISLLSGGCCKACPQPDIEMNIGKLNTGAKIATACVIFDATAMLTGVVLGILGILSIISMPSVASCALFGLSGAIIASWIAFAISSKGNSLLFAKELIVNSLKCSSPDKQTQTV